MINDIVNVGGGAMNEAAQRGHHIMESGQAAMSNHPEWEDKYRSLAEMFESADEQDQKLAATTAIVMQNEENFLEGMKSQYGEQTVINSLGTLAPRMIDVVRIFFPNMIANLIAEIQPLDRQSGEILTVKPIYTNSGGGVNAGDEVFLNRTDGNYASDRSNEVLGTGDGSTATFAGTTAFNPVRPGTLEIRVGGVANATDDGNGVLVGAGVSAGTINYLTGAVSVTYATGSEPAVSNSVTVEYRYDVEQSPDNIREMEIGLNLVPVQAKPHPLRVRWSVAAQLAATAQYSLDVQDTVSNMAAQFIKKERDYALTSRIVAAATAEADLNFDAAVPTGGGLTKRQHFQDFLIKVSRGDSLIFEKTNRGNVSFILGGTNISDLISTLANFVPEPRTVPIGAHKIGTIDGAIDVIKDASIDPNTYVMGFRGMQTGDAAIILAEWIPLFFTPVFQNSNLQNSQGMLSMYDMLVNNAKYYVSGTLSNYVA